MRDKLNLLGQRQSAHFPFKDPGSVKGLLIRPLRVFRQKGLLAWPCKVDFIFVELGCVECGSFTTWDYALL